MHLLKRGVIFIPGLAGPASSSLSLQTPTEEHVSLGSELPLWRSSGAYKEFLKSKVGGEVCVLQTLSLEVKFAAKVSAKC